MKVNLVFSISNLIINKIALANTWMSFSCSNLALIGNFIIQKLKSKHTYLKKIYKLSKTNTAKLTYFSLILREQEEKHPNISLQSLVNQCSFLMVSHIMAVQLKAVTMAKLGVPLKLILLVGNMQEMISMEIVLTMAAV